MDRWMYATEEGDVSCVDPPLKDSNPCNELRMGTYHLWKRFLLRA